MMKNLLKYGLVVLAVIASMSSLWADSSDIRQQDMYAKEALIDTFDTQDTLSSAEEISTIEKLLTGQTKFDRWIDGTDWIGVLDFIKNYKLEILLMIVGFCLIYFFLMYLLSLANRFITAEEFFLFEKVDVLRQYVFVLLFIFLSLLLDSTWFYLIVAALVVYYIEKWQLCPDLMKGMIRIIRILQGKQDLLPEQAAPTKSTVRAEDTQRLENERERIEDLALKHFIEDYPSMQIKVSLQYKEGKSIVVSGFCEGDSENIVYQVFYCNCLMATSLKLYRCLKKLKRASEFQQKKTNKETRIVLCVVCATSLFYTLAKWANPPCDTKRLKIEYYKEKEIQTQLKVKIL